MTGPAPDDRAAPADQPTRVLGLFDATCVVIGTVVGVGIFFTPAQVAGITMDAELALAAWVAAGVVAMLGALTFAALGTRYPANGGQYLALRDAFGPGIGFLFVFCNATAVQAGAIGIIALICIQHLSSALTGTPLDGPWLTLCSLALIVGLTGANVVGVRWGARIQNVTTAAKLLTLFFVALVAASAPRHDLPPPAGTDPSDAWLLPVLFMAMVPAFFSYGGWQSALWLAGEVRRPQRTLPAAIVGGVAIIICVYLAANWGCLRLLGPAGVAETDTPVSDAIARIMPSFGVRIVDGAIALSAFGVLNAQFLGGPRLIYGLARDGRFFAPFAQLHRRYATPAWSIVLLCAMASILLVAAGANAIEQLLAGVVFVDGIFFSLTGLALLVLHRHGTLRARPAVRAAAALFVVGMIGVVVGASTGPGTGVAAAIAAGWIVLAAAMYYARFHGPRPQPGARGGAGE